MRDYDVKPHKGETLKCGIYMDKQFMVEQHVPKEIKPLTGKSI
jgi:hypothetical protein